MNTATHKRDLLISTQWNVTFLQASTHKPTIADPQTGPFFTHIKYTNSTHQLVWTEHRMLHVCNSCTIHIYNVYIGPNLYDEEPSAFTVC